MEKQYKNCGKSCAVSPAIISEMSNIFVGAFVFATGKLLTGSCGRTLERQFDVVFVSPLCKMPS